MNKKKSISKFFADAYKDFAKKQVENLMVGDFNITVKMGEYEMFFDSKQPHLVEFTFDDYATLTVDTTEECGYETAIKEGIEALDDIKDAPIDVAPYKKNDGELYVSLTSKDGEEHEVILCELVWKTFMGDIPNGYKVVHIDGNKENNALTNLTLKKIA